MYLASLLGASDWACKPDPPGAWLGLAAGLARGTAVPARPCPPVRGRRSLRLVRVGCSVTGRGRSLVPAARIKGSPRKPLGRSLMLSAEQLGLSAQDVADIVAYLKTL